MKKFLFLIILCYTNTFFAQYDYECGMTPDDPASYPEGYQINPPQIGGKYAPAKTLNNSYVKILCVFAQFSEDNKDIDDVNWAKNQLPSWANSFIGTNINQAPFPPNTISNYFYEMSNGQNNIIGYVYPELVIVNGSINQDYGASNDTVLKKIDPFINFFHFDQWWMLANYQQYFNQTDNYVDAIYIIWRNIGYTWGGTAGLGTNYITNEGVIIDSRIPTISMTLNIGGKSDYTFENKIGLLAHEYGHYLFGDDHNFENNYYIGMPDGSIQRGLGLMNANSGGGFTLNPQEKYLLGYSTYTDIFYDQTGTLPDFNTSGTAYRIPIPTHINGLPNTIPDEFFVIANHQKISPYEIRENKGIYIYHIKNNFYSRNHIDMLTADGLWQWQVANWVPRPNGYGSPANWKRYHGNNPPELFPAIKKLSVDKVNGRDELQEVVYAQYPNENFYWWDRYLNENGVPYNGVVPEHSKPWSIGYNQVFSPWSNPPTYDKNRNQVNAAMEIINNNSGTFNVQFYIGENNCRLTAPTKPQNPRLLGSPKFGWVEVRWDGNLESDVNLYEVSRKVPEYGNYWSVIGTTTNTYFRDTEMLYAPGGGLVTPQYRVRAKDTQNKYSVYSDIVQVRAEPLGKESVISTEVKDYELSANYPNPFNPSTVINFAVKEAGLVKLKVYDILGAEVAELVNENKPAGNYEAEFNASQLPSGVYIYTLQVNGFTSSKKMLLMK